MEGLPFLSKNYSKTKDTAFIDIHTHIDQHDSNEIVDILKRASDAEVGAIITAGVTDTSSSMCVELAQSNECIFAGVGIHPQEITKPVSNQQLDTIKTLISYPKVVVMSEIGLDYQPSSINIWSLQKELFAEQINIATESKLPIVFHNRNADKDTLQLLKSEGGEQVGGAAHYFQGDWEYAQALLDMNFFISLAKPLLRMHELQEVSKKLPLDRIVLETDSYPQPFKSNRKKWTEPKDIPVIAVFLAQIRGICVDDIKHTILNNTLQMLGSRGKHIKALLSKSYTVKDTQID